MKPALAKERENPPQRISHSGSVIEKGISQKLLLKKDASAKVSVDPKIEDGADINKHPVRVFGSLTATIALKNAVKETSRKRHLLWH